MKLLSSLTYYCSSIEAQESPVFSLFAEIRIRRMYGDLTVNWYAEGTGKRKGLYIKSTDDMDETIEFAIRDNPWQLYLHRSKNVLACRVFS